MSWSGVVAVVGFVIRFQAYVTGTVYEPFGLKVTYEVSCLPSGCRDSQLPLISRLFSSCPESIVSNSRRQSSLFSGTEVRAEVPVVVYNL